jgi:hypothetical protein
MRLSSVLSLTFLLAVVAPVAGQAQPKEIRERLVIENARVGLPEGPRFDHGKYKTGFWAPVYVDLAVGPQDIPAGEAILVIETADNDGILNQYTQPLPSLPKKQTVAGLISYVRPGSYNSEIYISVNVGGRTVARRRADPDPLAVVDNGGVLWLSLGSKLPGLQRALAVRQNPVEGQVENNVADDDLMDSSVRRFAAIDRLEQMPTRWFGYQAVDVMVLASSSESFINSLIGDRSGRVEALTEWVRRGGRLVISAGHNQQPVDRLLARMKLMDCSLTGIDTLPRLIGFASVTSHFDSFQPQGGIEVARIAPRIGVDLLDDRLRETPDERGKQSVPLAVQAGCGLGRVILIGVDLDAPPFTAWRGQGDFWRFLQSKVEPRPGVADDGTGRMRGMRVRGYESNELAGLLQNHLEKFGDITVISFGWVALFILIYIIIVGPLDYLFLKKVVKRLELTWITFPAVVLLVSAAAYFTAYYLKGNDLKINKLDVIDIDLTPAIDAKSPPPRIYGSTWFTLFSPRIQHYTIGLEAADGWGGGRSNESPLIGWMGRPDDSFGGTGRAGSQSLFRRTYEYAPDAAGLTGVPIQVWATKSFTASWAVPSAATDSAPFSHDLKHPPADEQKVVGTVTNHLPADLVDVAVIYKGTAYPQGRLDTGVPKRLDFAIRGPGIKEWMRAPFTSPPRPGALLDDLSAFTFKREMKGLLFHDKSDADEHWSNTGLRQLDQGWRLKDRDEIVLVGRVESRTGEGPSESVATDSATPSRLWLGALPGSGSRPKLDGTMTQRTFVRVYIPVR